MHCYINKLLTEKGYAVTNESKGELQLITIKDKTNSKVAGGISFKNEISITGYKRRKEPKEEMAVHLLDIDVEQEYRGKHLSYYLIMLAMLHSKIHFPHINKVVLDDCSEKSGQFLGNLYYKIGMTTIESVELLLPNEVEYSEPISTKRGSEHVRIYTTEMVGNVNEIISKIFIKI
jgi:hypothetical protein